MSAMRIAVLGGGPGSLYFAALAKQLDPRHEITVWERNAADDTFGFGVVFSDETLGGIEHADVEIFQAMRREFARWDDIDVHFRGATLTSGGHGFAAMSRKRLLAILQARCTELGVRILFRTEAPDVAALSASYDLVVAADGMNSIPTPPTWNDGAAGTSGSAPAWFSTRSSSTSWTPRRESCRCTAIRTAARPAPSSWRCTRTSGGAPGSPMPTQRPPKDSRRARATKDPSSSSAPCARTCSAGTT